MKRPSDKINFAHFRAFTFGSDEEMIATFGSMDVAEREWLALRDDFLDRWNMWGMPQAWWRFEPGVPEELRTGPPVIFDERDAAEWDRIDAARREYLRSIGIDPGQD